MSMFDTIGKTADPTGRKENTLRKLERMNKALRHEEPDRVPISDFFWGGFTDAGARNSACPPTPIPITTTISIGSSRCRTWTRGSGRSRRSRKRRRKSW